VSSTLRTIADSLATGLQSVTWAITSTTVERRNWVTLDIADMETPVVIVTPGNAEVTRVGRTLSLIDYQVHVFVGRHVATDSAVNGMIDLADQVLSRVRAHSWPESVVWPTGVTSPNAVTIEINPDDALAERNVWRAVIVATYRVISPDSI
jgi:hypothetical protein